MFYGRELDKKNLKEELGDLLWYAGQAADELGTTIEQLMDENIAKLKARYPDKFTQEAEQGRDYQKEAEAVKQALTEGVMDALVYGKGVVEVAVDVDKPIASVCPRPRIDELIEQLDEDNTEY